MNTHLRACISIPSARSQPRLASSLPCSYVTKNLFKWEHLLYIVLMFVFLLLARVTYQVQHSFTPAYRANRAHAHTTKRAACPFQAKLWCYRTKSASPSEADGTERPVNNPNT